jgi:hypothetical protein
LGSKARAGFSFDGVLRLQIGGGRADGEFRSGAVGLVQGKRSGRVLSPITAWPGGVEDFKNKMLPETSKLGGSSGVRGGGREFSREFLMNANGPS